MFTSPTWSKCNIFGPFDRFERLFNFDKKYFSVGEIILFHQDLHICNHVCPMYSQYQSWTHSNYQFLYLSSKKSFFKCNWPRVLSFGSLVIVTVKNCSIYKDKMLCWSRGVRGSKTTTKLPPINVRDAILIQLQQPT